MTRKSIPAARVRARYSDETKEALARRIISGEASLTAVSAETRIAKSLLSKWVKNARTQSSPLAAGSGTATVAELQAKIERLESSLETLRRIVADSFAERTSLRFPSGR